MAPLFPGPPAILEIAKKGNEMKISRQLSDLSLWMKIWKDNRGQDLIEYALMAGFVAVAAGAIMPSVATNISIIFSKVGSVMTRAASTGS